MDASKAFQQLQSLYVAYIEADERCRNSIGHSDGEAYLFDRQLAMANGKIVGAIETYCAFTGEDFFDVQRQVINAVESLNA